MQPEWVFSGEMWAEMATNYFVNSNSSSIVTKLTATDFGYIPLPQRLIAATIQLLGTSATVIPYIYTWAGIALSATIVGSFCLAQFRCVLPSDSGRAVLVAITLLLVDFETRTFINFTYFAGFLLATLAARAATSDTRAPRWTWLALVLVISKPAVMAAVPAIVAIALLKRGRFRLFAAIAISLCAIQIGRLLLTQSQTSLVTSSTSVVDKLFTTATYLLGYFGAFFVGRKWSATLESPVLVGITLLTLSAALVKSGRGNEKILFPIGLSLMAFNFLLNSFAPGTWNNSLDRIIHAPISRHNIIALHGFLLSMGAAFSVIGEKIEHQLPLIKKSITCPLLLVMWLIFSGWWDAAKEFNRAPTPPMLGVSHWQDLAPLIDANQAACIPINPLGWAYHSKCELISDAISLGHGIRFSGSLTETPLPGPSKLANVTDKSNLFAIGILARPKQRIHRQLTPHIQLTLTNGTVVNLIPSKSLPATGGLLLFNANSQLQVTRIAKATLIVDTDMEIGFADALDKVPATYWFSTR